jgi:hypothetical protein
MKSKVKFKSAVKAIAFSFLVGILGGCSAAQKDNLAQFNEANDGANFSAFLDNISKITQQDIATALADVHAKGDVDLAALSCYPALSEFLNNPNIKLSQPTIDGVISLNQLKRDVMLGINSGTSPQQMALRKLHVACAAYVNDERNFAIKFGLMVGAASHGAAGVGGISDAIGGLVR